MDKTQNLLVKLQEIETIDPKIIVINNTIYIKPYYWNYPFVTNFLGISIFIYLLFSQNDLLFNLACFVGIGAFVILIITVFKYYNTISIDIDKKKITIQPSPISLLQRKKEIIYFNTIKTVFVKSNYKSTGYWYMNRRYYITLLLNNSDEVKLIASNKNETAIIIAENINPILKQL